MCTVDECPTPGRTTSGEGLCEKHYYRLRRTGTTADPPRVGGPCSACDRLAEFRDGYCRMHHLRVIKRGDPNFVMVGENHPFWQGDEASYSAVHQRVRKLRGKARYHDCVDCGDPALHWSYNHSGIGEQTYRGMRYSVDIDQYEPRCVPCHKRMDLAVLSHE